MITRFTNIPRSVGTAAALLAFMAYAGCGGPANEYDSTVTGTVTVDGELANSGLVTFHPAKDGVPAIGRIHTDGSYSLRTGQGDLREVDGGTVRSGEYVVTVTVTGPEGKNPQAAEGGPPVPGPSLVASKYATKETSDLKYTVKPGTQVIVLELDRAEPEPPAEDTTEAEGEAAEPGEAQPATEPAAEAAPAAAPQAGEGTAETATGSPSNGAAEPSETSAEVKE